MWIQHWKMSGQCFHCRFKYFFFVFLSVRVLGEILLLIVMTAECQNLKKILNHLLQSVSSNNYWIPHKVIFIVHRKEKIIFNKELRMAFVSVMCWTPKYFKKYYCWYCKVVLYLYICCLFACLLGFFLGGGGGGEG